MSDGQMKAILLAGGSGSRLYPMTTCTNKHLLPVYDKPMVYYPLSLIMLAGIRNALIISTPRDLPTFQDLLDDGSRFGMRLEYATQEVPDGLARALVIGEDYLAGAPCCLVLGDNLLWGHRLAEVLLQSARTRVGAQLFAYPVKNPEDYGIVTLDAQENALDLIEKPSSPTGNLAVPGIYFYDGHAPRYAMSLEPSDRGELEITDLNRIYLEKGQLKVRRLGRGIAWLDAGTTAGLLEASAFIRTLQERTNLNVACLEEIAWRQDWISAGEALAVAETLGNSSYGQYLRRIVLSACPQAAVDSYPGE
jgi:glucose-1-phosphate thymidylyltransferase